MEEPAVSYKSLRKVQQAEQNAAVLTKLETGYYHDVAAYLKALESSVASERQQQKSRLFAEELANTRKLVAGIYELREKKIVAAALVAARGGVPDIRNLAEEERPLYERLLREISRARQAVLGEESSPEESAASSVPVASSLKTPPQAPVASPAPPVPAAPVVSKGQANPHPMLRVAQTMPPFVGTDLRVYELRADDVLTLPAEMAEPLLRRGILVPIE